MTVDELTDLLEGDRARWNRICELVAWGVHKIVMTIPKISRGGDWRNQARSLPEFLTNFPPPGYAPDKKRQRRVRRVSPQQLLSELQEKEGSGGS